MNYYQHHIGDFNNATRHLSLIERAIYRDLLDMYYDTEQPLDASNLDRLARRVQCSTDEQVKALQYVLEEFFTLNNGLYINNRCEREISEYHGKRKQASEAGKASAKKRAAKKQQDPNGGSPTVKQDSNCNSTTVENPLNENLTDEQLTINHKPITINQEPIFKREDANSEISDSRFDLSLNDVNTKLQMGGLKPISQEELQSLLVKLQSSYGHKTQMVKNQILGKAFEWIERQRRTPLQQPKPQVSRSTAQTLAEQRAAMSQNQHQGQIIDVGEPKKPLMIEEVGRA